MTNHSQGQTAPIEEATQPGSAPAKQEAQIDALLCGLLTESVACRVLEIEGARMTVVIATTRVAQLQPLLARPREIFVLTAQPGKDHPRPLMLRTTSTAMQGQRITLQIVTPETRAQRERPRLVVASPQDPPVAETLDSEAPTIAVLPEAIDDAPAAATEPAPTPAPAVIAEPPRPRASRRHQEAKLPPRRMSERSAPAQQLDRFLKSLLVETGVLGEQYFVMLGRALTELRQTESGSAELDIITIAEQEVEKLKRERIWSLQWSVVSDTSRLIGQQLDSLAKRSPPKQGSSEMLLMRTGELNEMIALGNIAERLEARFRPSVFDILQRVGLLCDREFPDSENPLTVERMIARLNDITPDAWTTPLLHPLFFHILEIDMKAPLGNWYDALKRVLS